VGGGQLFFGLFVLFKQRIPEFIKVSPGGESAIK
jgi:hypothetical protein